MKRLMSMLRAMAAAFSYDCREQPKAAPSATTARPGTLASCEPEGATLERPAPLPLIPGGEHEAFKATMSVTVSVTAMTIPKDVQDRCKFCAFHDDGENKFGHFCEAAKCGIEDDDQEQLVYRIDGISRRNQVKKS